MNDYYVQATCREIRASARVVGWSPPSPGTSAGFWLVNDLGEVKPVAEVLPLFGDRRIRAIADLLEEEDGHHLDNLIPGPVVMIEPTAQDGHNSWYSVDPGGESGEPLLTQGHGPDGDRADVRCHFAWLDYHYRAAKILKTVLEASDD